MPAVARKLQIAQSDGELMRSVASGELDALGTLYDRHADAVRRFALRVTGDETMADDVTQDAFLALPKAAARFDDARSARAYIVGIAGKLVLRRKRRSAIGLRIICAMKEWVQRVEDRTPEDNASVQLDLERMRRALDRMPASKRVPFIMADIEGLSGREIADALDIPLNTVWTRLHHARAKLRAEMCKG